MYRRLAECDMQESICTVVADLQSGYGDLPDAVRKLVKHHELRIASSTMGILSMTVDEHDVVIRTKQSKVLRRQMQGVKGTLRLVGAPSKHGFVAVYLRPTHAKTPQKLLELLHCTLVESSSLG